LVYSWTPTREWGHIVTYILVAMVPIVAILLVVIRRRRR